ALALDVAAVREHEAHLAVRELGAARDLRIAEEAEQAAAARLPHDLRAADRLHRAGEELAPARAAAVDQDRDRPAIRVRVALDLALEPDDLHRAEEERDGLAVARGGRADRRAPGEEAL